MKTCSPNKSPYANMNVTRTAWGPRYASFTETSSLSEDALTLQLLLLRSYRKVSSKTYECFS